jgi:hypothetical protein
MGKNMIKLETKDIQYRAAKDQLVSLVVHSLARCQTLLLHSLRWLDGLCVRATRCSLI